MNKLNIGQILQYIDCFCNGLEFTQSHRREEVMPNSYDKCKLGLSRVLATGKNTALNVVF